jgi:hypothetical protein
MTEPKQTKDYQARTSFGAERQNAVSKTKVSKISYDLIDMILIALDNLYLASDLYRDWAAKNIAHYNHIDIDYMIDDELSPNELRRVIFMYNVGIKHTDTVIDRASKFGYLDVIKFFYSLGVKHSMWAMTTAASHGYLDIVKFLYNSDIVCTSAAIYYACKNNHKEIVDFLQCYDSHSIETVYKAYESKYLIACRYLCDNSIWRVGIEDFISEGESDKFKNIKFLHTKECRGNGEMRYAILHKDLKIVKFLHCVGIKFNKEHLEMLQSYNRMEILQWYKSL